MPIDAVIAAPDRYSASKPAALACKRRHAVVRAGHLQDAGPGEQRTKAFAGRSGRQIGGDQIGHGGHSGLRRSA